MRKLARVTLADAPFVLALLLALLCLFVALFLIGCGSGGEETPAPDASATPEVDAQPFHRLEPDAGRAEALPRDTLPPDPNGITYIGGVPFGPPEPDGSDCPCGWGCNVITTPDGSGYYCHRVCTSCD
jgi:hypothetical protein